MSIYLRQSTASQEVPLGQFVDDTDGKTAETALTISNTDIKIWVTGSTTLANKNSGGATHISGGIYYCVLDATDTATIGPLVIFVSVTGALAVRAECVVLDETVYDVMFGTAGIATATALGVVDDFLDTEMAAVLAAVDTEVAAIKTVTDQMVFGTANRLNVQVFGAEANTLTASALATDAVTEIQSGLATAAALTTVGTNVSTIAGYLDTEVATILAAVDTEVASIKAVTDQMVFGTANRLNVQVFGMQADTLTASALATDAVTEIQSGLATASSLTTVGTNVTTIAGYLDTEVAAILAAVDTEVAAIKVTTDRLETTWVLDGAVYQFTVNALELAPSGGGGGSTDWNADERTAIRDALGIPASGSTLEAAGILLAKTTNITGFNDITTANVLTQATAALNAYDPPTSAEMDARTLVTASYATAANQTTINSNISVVNTNVLTVDTVVDSIKVVTDRLATTYVLDGGVYQFTANALELAPTGGGGGASVQDIVDGVLDELLASHTVTGSVGAAIAAAGTAGDPLIGEIEPASAGGDAVNLKQAIQMMLSFMLGITEGGGTETLTFTDVNNQVTRLTLNVDSNSNRLSVERNV